MTTFHSVERESSLPASVADLTDIDTNVESQTKDKAPELPSRAVREIMAFQMIQNGKASSLFKAAEAVEVPRSSLNHRKVRPPIFRDCVCVC